MDEERHADPDGHAYGYTDCDPDGNTHGHAYGNPDSYADGNSDGHTGADRPAAAHA